MQVLIPCAGKQLRWREGRWATNKHFAEVAEQPVIERLVNQVTKFAPTARVSVVARPDNLSEYAYLASEYAYLGEGSVQVVPARLTPDWGDVDKFMSSMWLWQPHETTVVLFGDVFFSTAAIRRVLRFRTAKWRAWLRFGPGGHGGEIFGFTFGPGTLDRVRLACRQVPSDVRGGWGLYRELNGADPRVHRRLANHNEINDVTDDVDSPVKWERLCAKIDKLSESQRRQQIVY